MPLPLFTLVRQRDSHPAVEDVAGEVRRQWEQSGVLKKLPAKARVAVAVGSRGDSQS
ncbi:MAG: hypothetical protein KatS3mg105_3881 [Gemmatales bacterium]|nr:MAG: hypothetical protein KatS3mg105_3881 [Gemmatales bacterium]